MGADHAGLPRACVGSRSATRRGMSTASPSSAVPGCGCPARNAWTRCARYVSAGLSIRAIASATGISDQTVQRDLASGVVNRYTPRPARPTAEVVDAEVVPRAGHRPRRQNLPGQTQAGCADAEAIEHVQRPVLPRPGRAATQCSAPATIRLRSRDSPSTSTRCAATTATASPGRRRSSAGVLAQMSTDQGELFADTDGAAIG